MLRNDETAGVYFDSWVQGSTPEPHGMIVDASGERHMMISWDMRDGHATDFECYCGAIMATQEMMAAHVREQENRCTSASNAPNDTYSTSSR